MKIIIITILASLNILYSQSILSANPNLLVNYEYNNFFNNKNNYLTVIRPQIDNSIQNLYIKVSNQFFYNNNSPNFENRGNVIIGKGLGNYLGLKLTLFKKFFTFSVEPYFYMNQNKIFDITIRDGHFSYLNDKSYNDNNPIREVSIREGFLYFTLNEFAFGVSNANMWWGPGIHSSLTMTNNTEGFPHLMIGTLKEKKYRNIGYNFRYIFSKLNKTKNNPYYSALVLRTTFYNNPAISIGINRNIVILDNKINPATIIFNPSYNLLIDVIISFSFNESNILLNVL